MSRPPFARSLSIKTEEAICVYPGTDLGWARARRDINEGINALVCPDPNTPNKWTWPVSGRRVLIAQDDSQDFDMLCRHLIHQGANEVLWLRHAGEDLLYLPMEPEIA